MTVGAGKTFLLKIDTGGGTYVSLGGIRSNSATLNNEAIDITNMDSSEYRTLLDGAGIRSMDISGSGVLENEAPISTVRTAFLAGTLTNFNLVETNGTWSGAFKITSFEISGEYNGAQTYSVSLQSSGTITFT